MAHHYLQFCTRVEFRDDAEFDWFREQLGSVLLPDPREPGDERRWHRFEDVPEDLAVREAIRFLVDDPDIEESDELDVGFESTFDPASRSVDFEADESGNPDRLGLLLHRFLARFRPSECLAFTWAVICDRTLVDAFDGGAIVATPRGWTGITGRAWAERTARLCEITAGDPTGEHADFPRGDWQAEVAVGDTRLGYMEWVLSRLDDPCVCEQPGLTNCGVPGVLAWTVEGRVLPDAVVERCDACERFPDDESARLELERRGLVPPPSPPPPPVRVRVVLSDERGVDFDEGTFDDQRSLEQFVANAAVTCGLHPEGDGEGRQSITIRVEPLPTT